jgi:hypothetical protein
MEAFHGNPAFRDKFIEGMEAHQKEDRLRQGSYGDLCEDGLWRGCTIACQLLTKDLLETGRSNRVKGNARGEIAEYLNIPYELTIFQDIVFENLDPRDAQQWSIDFLKAIRCGADLSAVWPRLVHWMFGGLRTTEDVQSKSPYFRAYNVSVMVKDYEKRRVLRYGEELPTIYEALAKKAIELVGAT